MYTGQIEKGQNYDVLKKCVSISILDFVLFENEPDFYSRFHILEDTRHFIYTDKMEFHVLELPKLPPELIDGSSDILLWAKFINSERKEEFDMLATKNPYIGSAYEHLQVISQDREKRLEYEAREKAIRDYNQGILEAEQRGEDRERAQGIKILITDNIEEKVPKEKTLAKLQKHYNLTESQAEKYYIEFAKKNL